MEDWGRGSIRDLLQRIPEEEVTEVLGRTRYERRPAVDGPPGSRNGYGRPRRLALMSGTIDLRRPRVRGLEARFETPKGNTPTSPSLFYNKPGDRLLILSKK